MWEIVRRKGDLRRVLWTGELGEGEALFGSHLDDAVRDRFGGYLLLVEQGSGDLASWALLDGGAVVWGMYR